MSDTADIERIERALREGLEGVTPGPWDFMAITPGDGFQYAAVILGSEVTHGRPVIADIPPRTAHGTHEANAAHIARCSAENIRVLLDEIDRLRSLLEGRDRFIVNNGLWSDFVAALPARAFLERKGGAE